MQNVEKLIYWINERESVRLKKEGDALKPWSSDKVFQETYFCNIHREDDKVTRWIRLMYSRYFTYSLFEWNIVFSRFINYIPTLERIGFMEKFEPEVLRGELAEIASNGKLWGNAYIITTHGQKMSKLDYFIDQVLADVNSMDGIGGWGTLREAHQYFTTVDGIGSFLAAQIVADLKNTDGHPLADASDWWTFSAPGPGSLRGLNWIYGIQPRITTKNYEKHILSLYRSIPDRIPPMCMQDFQNCLCEFDKYMRVSTGTGRSKRKYHGA